jgi:hypothetical protein
MIDPPVPVPAHPFWCDDCGAAAHTLADQIRQRQWQPIDTAPKDGRDVLCTWVHTFADGRQVWLKVMHVLAYWPNWHGEGRGAWVLDGDFATKFDPDGWHHTPPIDGGAPTHWMPLPAASPLDETRPTGEPT